MLPGDRDGEKHFLWSNSLISTPNPYETGSIVCNFADEKVKREKLGISEAAVGIRTSGPPRSCSADSGIQSILWYQRESLRQLFIFPEEIHAESGS